MNDLESHENYEELCSSCFGYGRIENPDMSFESEIDCPTCKGDGHIEKTPDEYLIRRNEIEKIKQFIQIKPDYKVSDIQRLLMKGYKYCFQLLEEIGKR